MFFQLGVFAATYAPGQHACSYGCLRQIVLRHENLDRFLARLRRVWPSIETDIDTIAANEITRRKFVSMAQRTEYLVGRIRRPQHQVIVET
ncbi:hypothetical protein N181_07720 [Sinorhizobium fredii USDA 205]|nr:hypothetical protein N181_07720 [Sinorhizobium fredii USDA 205]